MVFSASGDSGVLPNFAQALFPKRKQCLFKIRVDKQRVLWYFPLRAIQASLTGFEPMTCAMLLKRSTIYHVAFMCCRDSMKEMSIYFEVRAVNDRIYRIEESFVLKESQ